MAGIPLFRTIAPGSTASNFTVPLLSGLDLQPNLMFAQGELSLTRITVQVLTSGGLVPWNSPCGVKCPYAVSFLGPACQCDELGPLATAPVNVTQLFREGCVQPSLF